MTRTRPRREGAREGRDVLAVTSIPGSVISRFPRREEYLTEYRPCEIAGADVVSNDVGQSSDYTGRHVRKTVRKGGLLMTASIQGLTGQSLAGAGLQPQLGGFSPGFPQPIGVEQYFGMAP